MTCEKSVEQYRKMMYGWVIVLKVMDAELHKAEGMCLALWWGAIFCKPEQSGKQPAGQTQEILPLIAAVP